MSNYLVPQLAVDLVAEFEGFRSHAYRCPAGVWTVGYGLTSGAVPGVVVDASTYLTEPMARQCLRHVLDIFARKIASKITVQLATHEWAAILSLAYNIGPTAFARSTVLRKLNAGDRVGAADAFRMWNKAKGKVLKGLVKRRERERLVFLGNV